MAEFQDIMRQLGRICSTNFGECDICDLRPFCPSKTFLDKYVKSGRTERLEEMVLSWAAEHPEPVYMTWGAWFVERGDLVEGWQNATNAAWMANTALSVFMKPIPADIAEKLGIEPKEGI